MKKIRFGLFIIPIVLILASPLWARSSKKKEESTTKKTHFSGDDFHATKSFVPLAVLRVKTDNKGTDLDWIKNVMSTKVTELGGDAVLSFDCSPGGANEEPFFPFGIPRKTMKGCYGVGIRWTIEGEEGQRKITGREQLPSYDLE